MCIDGDRMLQCCGDCQNIGLGERHDAGGCRAGAGVDEGMRGAFMMTTMTFSCSTLAIDGISAIIMANSTCITIF